MSNRRRHKKRFQSSSLDPSWILPDDEQDGLSITLSNHSDTKSISSSLAERDSIRNFVRSDHSDGPSSSPSHAPDLASGAASRLDVSNADGSSYASSGSSSKLVLPSYDGESPRKSEDDAGSAALLHPGQPSQAKGRRKKRYAKKHASDWLIDNKDSSSAKMEDEATSVSQVAPQSLERHDKPRRVTAPAPDEERSNDTESVVDTSPPEAVFSFFCSQRPSHNSPGYDAPPIAPQGPSTYSPNFTYH